MNDTQETEIALTQVRHIGQLNLNGISAISPVLVQAPPPLKGNQFFIVDSWHIDDNQLRFEFKMCEVPDVESPVSTPCGRAYRNAVRRWMQMQELRAQRERRAQRILKSLERLPLSQQKMLHDYYGKTKQGRRRLALKWSIPVTGVVDVRVGGRVSHVPESDAGVQEFITACIRERYSDYDTSVSTRIDAHHAFSSARRGYELFELLRSRYPKASAWYDDLNGRFYTRVGRKWYCPAKTFVTLPSPYTVPLNRNSRAYRWAKLEQQDE